MEGRKRGGRAGAYAHYALEAGWLGFMLLLMMRVLCLPAAISQSPHWFVLWCTPHSHVAAPKTPEQLRQEQEAKIRAAAQARSGGTSRRRRH